MRTVDLIVLLGYLICTTLYGCWFVLRSRSPEGFMVARGGLPTWAVGLSIFGTFVSSISFLGFLVICWATFSSKQVWFGNPFHDYFTVVFGTLTIFFTGFLASYFLKPRDGAVNAEHEIPRSR